MNLINETDLQDNLRTVGEGVLVGLGSSYDLGGAAVPVISDSVRAIGKGRSVEDVGDEDDADEDEDEDLDEDDLEDDEEEDDFEDEDDEDFEDDDEDDEYDDDEDEDEDEDDEDEVN